MSSKFKGDPRTRLVPLALVAFSACFSPGGNNDTAGSGSSTSQSGSSTGASTTAASATTALTTGDSGSGTQGQTTSTSTSSTSTSSTSSTSTGTTDASSSGGSTTSTTSTTGGSTATDGCSPQDGPCNDGQTCCDMLFCCGGVPVPPGEEYCSNECPMSDRNLKTDVRPINVKDILARVVALDITTWRYKKDTAEVRHLGPMAQDFKAAFGLWDTDTMIFPLDATGVSMAAIQGLHRRLVATEAENDDLRGRLERLERRFVDIEAR